MECPKCEGSGWKYMLKVGKNQFECTLTDKCKHCDGTGSLPDKTWWKCNVLWEFSGKVDILILLWKDNWWHTWSEENPDQWHPDHKTTITPLGRMLELE